MAGRGVGLVLAALVAGGVSAGDQEPADDAIALVDAAGKEHKLTGARPTAGTRRVAWLADPKGTTDDARRGPLALEVRETHSTTFQNGVVTLVPLGSVEAVRYEYEKDKQAMTVAVKGLAEPLRGMLGYEKINVLVLDGKGGKFTGGVPKDGFRSVAFPGAKPIPVRPAGGVAWAVQIAQPKAGNPSLPVRNLKALYTFPGGAQELKDALPTRKGEPLALTAAVKKLEVVAVDLNTQTAVLEVTAADGAERLVAVPLALTDGKRAGTLVGLVGEVDAGWKMFPLHSIKVVTRDEKK